MTKRSFFTWRQALLRSEEISTTKHVLLTLACHMNDAGESCFPSVEQLAREASLSRRAVIEHLKIAARAGWIRVTKHGFKGQRWKRNDYAIAWPRSLKRSYRDDSKNVHFDDKGAKDGYPDDTNAVQEDNQDKSTPKNSSEIDDESHARSKKINRNDDATAEPVIDWFPTAERKVAKILGVANDPNWLGRFGRLKHWVAEGADLESDVYPVIETVMARRNSVPPNSLKYFDKEVAAAVNDRCSAPVLPANRPKQIATHSAPIELPANVTESCSPEAAERWRRIVRIAARRHGHVEVANWFKGLCFDGATIWADSQFIRDSVQTRFEPDLAGLPVVVRR